MAKSGPPKKTKSAEQYVVDNPHLLNEWWTADQIHAHADAAYKYFKKNILEFWAWQYCIEEELPRSTVKRWITDNAYFAKRWEQIKMLCEARMFKLGCNKDNASSMFRFGLKNAHGWREDPADPDPKDHELNVDHNGFQDGE